MQFTKMTFNIVICTLAVAGLTACSGGNPEVSVLPETNFFVAESPVNNKVDILFVIDNSGSMAENQQNVADNFNSFINDFVASGYDFKLAVTASDAYRHLYVSNPAQKQALVEFRDGTSATGFTGIKVILPNSSAAPTFPTIQNIFAHNIKQGTNGSGDERPLSSFVEALESNYNSGFLRADAYLAIVIVTDEEDFSWNGSSCKQCTNDTTNLYTVQSYVDKLLTYKNNVASRFSVNGIYIKPGDTACLNANNPWGMFANRVDQLVSQTNGVSGSICDTNFSSTLAQIAQNVATESTQFYLTREPIVATITVAINGVNVPQSAVNGWQYSATNNSIKFYGSFVPNQGDVIAVDYDPVGLIE